MDQRERELLAALRAAKDGTEEQPPKKETELSLAEWIRGEEKEWNQRHVEVGRTIERLSFNEEGNLTTKQVEMLEDALRHWSRLWWDFSVKLRNRTKDVLMKEGKLVAEFDPAMPGKIRLGNKYRKNF
jgi:hypothetical protein